MVPLKENRAIVLQAKLAAKLGKAQWESEFEPGLNVVAVEVAAKLGKGQWESEFESKLNVVAVKVTAT